MGRLISEKCAISQHKNNLRNICETFAAEGMSISESTRRNLGRIASGQTSYPQVLTELRAKYEKRGQGHVFQIRLLHHSPVHVLLPGQ